MLRLDLWYQKAHLSISFYIDIYNANTLECIRFEEGSTCWFTIVTEMYQKDHIKVALCGIFFSEFL